MWGNISQCSAFSVDLTYWYDGNELIIVKIIDLRLVYSESLARHQNARMCSLFKLISSLIPTQFPSTSYDIQGVFDGSVIMDGYRGYPTMIYTSVSEGTVGALSSPPEQEGTETQSIAYTINGGITWIRPEDEDGINPVIRNWPMEHLTGFRDPYAFESSVLAKILRNSMPIAGTTGDIFLTISGGIRLDADPGAGPCLMLYRQTLPGDLTKWTYLGPLISVPAYSSFSDWSGNFGINFETSGVTRLNENGMAYDDGADPRALNVLVLGTEHGRNGSHEDHWPLCECYFAG